MGVGIMKKKIQLMYDADEVGEIVCVFADHKMIYEGSASAPKLLTDVLEAFVAEGIIDSLSLEIK